MGIKKRAQPDQARIEAFGAAADGPATPTPTPTPTPAAAPAAVPGKTTAVAAPWPVDVPKSMLIRWPDAALAIELAQVAALEDRSQHKTALRALQRGLEILRAEHDV
jgi:hypothetical protein